MHPASTQDPPGNEEEPSRVRPVAGARDLLRSGQILAGAYEIRSKIGEGGMGQVYAAWDRGLGRHVAIKISSARDAEWLHREARALATLRHRGIVSVHAVGEHEGLPFVVMEHVRGRTLEAHLQAPRTRGSLVALDEAVDLLTGIAEALAFVHGAGMAHRDVKPANILIGPHDRVVLTDFGIFQPESEFHAGLHCAGSPHYIAPEAVTMSIEAGELYLVDVYSLGVVAYQLLTGSVPYEDANDVRILWRHVTDPVPDPASARPELPPGLASLVREMLAKDPKSRPHSMDAVAWRLHRARLQLRQHERPCSILLAEDNEATAAILSALVAEGSPDADVRAARDGQQALDMALRQTPDLLVIDLHLPRLSGVDVCSRLSATRVAHRSTVIATSSQATPEEIAALRRLGFVQYVPKGDVLASKLPAIARTVEQRVRERGTSRSSRP